MSAQILFAVLALLAVSALVVLGFVTHRFDDCGPITDLSPLTTGRTER